MDTRVNNQIHAPQVQVVSLDGQYLGALPIAHALAAAREMGTDLIEVAPHAEPPVCRLMDYAVFRHQAAKMRRDRGSS